MIRSKKQALRQFFFRYANDIGELDCLDIEALKEELTGNVVVSGAAAATGIEEDEFIHYAVKHRGHLAEG